MGKTGVCPIRSEELVEFALNALREKGALDDLPEETYRQDADRLKKLLPDHYLPDIYLDLPLKGGYSGMAAIFDCYDRCYADFASDGEYFTGIGAEPMKDPENRDDLLVMKVCDSGVGYAVRKRKLREASALTEYDDPSGFSFLNKLKTLPVSFEIEPREDGFRLIFTTGRSDARKRFSRKPFKNEIIQLLAEAGCEKEALGRLESASFNCGPPFLDSRGGYSEWYICLDVAAFIIEIKDGKVSESHAVIRISDRSMIYSRIAIKRTQAYQWHITDNCDQRCRHCYLFAEDARLKCVTTPWEQLMLTLDKITEDAAYRYGLPMPAISGGDPLLHPDFWRFAKELHRRGIHWDIMGNPFHLNEEVCHRLYGLGCFKYQLSLDGLREYHDHMRKPGSFQATLDAVKLLNDAGIQTQLMATVSRQNMQDVLECMDIAAEHNVTDFTFARYCATSPEKAEESYPSPEEYRDFLYSYYRKAGEYEANNCKTRFKFKEHLFTLVKYELGEFKPSEYSKEHPELIFDGCHLGQGCSILANGDLMACRRMESVIGNVKTGSIREVLTGELCHSYMDISNIKKCRDCELLQWCRGCRAVGFNATGDLQASDPCCWKE